ncbi:MAG: T9SS type A sorting domain-containing protein, partial [candidate division WOR-3 bacterium]
PIKVIGCTLLVDTPELVITVPDLRVNDICSPFATGEASPSPSGWLALFPAPRGFGIADYSGKALVYDPTGRLVLSREITDKTLISPLRPGVYFVVAGSQRARITVR